MPIYSDDYNPLFSSLGVGPRGNGIYLSGRTYEYKQDRTYTCDVSDYETEQRGTIHRIRVGDIVVFKTLCENISKFNVGIVNLVNADEIVFTSRAEINVGTMQEIADGSITRNKISIDAVGSDELDSTDVDSGSYGSESDQTPDFGDTFTSISFTVDEDGRLTKAEEHTVKMPETVMSASHKGIAKVGSGLKMYGDTLQLDGGNISAAVTAWLNDHPEATTTVLDGSITTVKLSEDAVTDDKLTNIGHVLPNMIRDNLYAQNMLFGNTLNHNHQEYGAVVDGSFEKGFTISNLSSDSVIALRLSNNTVHLKAGNSYILFDEVDANNNVGLSTYRFDIRDADNPDTVLAYMSGSSGKMIYTPKQDVDVYLFMRVANVSSINGRFVMPCIKEYIEPVYEASQRALRGEQYNLVLKENIRESSSSDGLTITNNNDGTLTLNGTIATTSSYSITIDQLMLYLEAGHSYVFGSLIPYTFDPSWDSVFIGLTDENFNWLKQDIRGNGCTIAIENSGYYQLKVRVKGNFACNNITIKPYIYDVKYMNKNKNRLKVCEFNIGNFSHGASGYAQGDDQLYDDLIDVFSKNEADIYMFSEWDEYWNFEDGILSEDVLSWVKPYRTKEFDKTEGRYVSQMTYSDLPLLDESLTYFGDGESRHYVDDTVIVNGNVVHIINTHLPLSSQSLRRDDIDKIFTYINDNNIEYYIIGGDFNLGLPAANQEEKISNAKSDIAFIEGHGATSVQGCEMCKKSNEGLFDTYVYNDIDIISPYDNMIVSPNIVIRNAYTIDSGASDHIPLFAEFEIL